MKEIRYTSHLELRLKLRKIPYNLAKTVYQTSKERYFDKETRSFIAIKRIRRGKKIREFVLVYQEALDLVDLVTIHPLKINQKINRIKSGRWQKL